MKLERYSCTLAIVALGMSSQLFANGSNDGFQPDDVFVKQAWTNVQPSIGWLKRSGKTVGSAVFISSGGYLIANQLVSTNQPDEVETSAGKRYRLKFIARDATSQLDLLQTVGEPEGIRPVVVANLKSQMETSILAVLSNGDRFHVESTGTEMLGVDQKTRKAVPMFAIRCEQPQTILGGSLLFSSQGHLIGAIAATLSDRKTEGQQSDTQGKSLNQKSTLAQGAAQNQGFAANNLSRNYGPQGLVVAYSPTWEVTQKAIQGFLSPNHRAEYGLLGVYVQNRADNLKGVRVTGLMPGSAIARSGLMQGDIITRIDGTEIKNQIDFFRVTYRLDPGSVISVQFLRGPEVRLINIEVGRALQVSSQSAGIPYATNLLPSKGTPKSPN